MFGLCSVMVIKDDLAGENSIRHDHDADIIT